MTGKTKSPGIFNDVIGPVMRGPSSSHTAASWRIAKTCLDILNEPLKNILVEFDKNGAWAPNYREQGTVMGLNGGFLGLDITDSGMKETEKLVSEKEMTIVYEVNSFPTRHANTVRLSLTGQSGKEAQIVAVSSGGGAFEIQQINEWEVSVMGDYYELLLIFEKEDFKENIKKIFPANQKVSEQTKGNQKLFHAKFSDKPADKLLEGIKTTFRPHTFILIKPVLPVISGNETTIPFTDINSLLVHADKEGLNLGQLGMIYEQGLSGLTQTELRHKMLQLIEIINKGINTGLAGTDYDDRILPPQSQLIKKAAKAGKILPNTVVNEIIANVTALMEAKSAMEVIVANPTAGSCGTVGGVLKALADEMEVNSKQMVDAYFAAGIIGVFFAKGPGFSAEEHGCQVECGAASGMAAAAIAQLFGGTAKQAIDAASMAIQNTIGLICDPVADRVEVPCLGKNINATLNALSSATMACSGFAAVIPLEEVIESVASVGRQMPACLKCTGKGGLAITKTAIKLKEELGNKNL